MSAVQIKYFSDVLCVWAYVSQARIDAIQDKFGDDVRIEHRFCSVFGDTAQKITSAWKDKGGYEGFNLHLRRVAERFPHINIHPEIWLKTRPPTSASPHLFMKAVQQWERESAAVKGIFEKVARALRRAFFQDCRDISRWDIQCEVTESLGVDIGAIEKLIHSGVAYARLAADYQDAE